MLKATEIIDIKGYSLICKFNNGQLRMVSIDQLMLNEPNMKIVETVLDKTNFLNVRVGSRGQILWPNSATMKDESGESIICEYDMSGEYVYQHSLAIE